MGLKLKTVPARQGWVWFRQGTTECLRHPVGYTGLFVLFFLGVLLLTLIPFFGGPLMLMAVPLLSLAYMMATAASQRSLPVLPVVYLAPWQGDDAKRKRALLTLCLNYALATVAVLALARLVDGGAFEKFLDAFLKGDLPQEELQRLINAPGMQAGVALRVVGSALISILFWHAPGLVHWGGQSPWQAVFSSTMAVWRNRGAFAVYGLAWSAAGLVAMSITSTLAVLLGLGALGAVLIMPLALFLTTAFYASLYFCFVDSFARDDTAPGGAASAASQPRPDQIEP